MSRIRIVARPGVRGNVVEVDSVDIANGCSQYVLSAQAGCLPRLDVELAIHEVAVIDGEADVRVVMTDAAREALVALGWRPPDE